MGFCGNDAENAILKEDEKGGNGIIQNVIANRDMIDDFSYENYLKGTFIS